MNRVEIVRVSGYTGIMTIEGFSGDTIDFGGSTSSTSDWANHSPYGLDIGFMIKAAELFLVTPCDIFFTDLNSKSVCFLGVRTFRPTDISPHGRTFRPKDDLPHGRC